MIRITLHRGGLLAPLLLFLACAAPASDVLPAGAYAPAVKRLENDAPRRILFVGNSYFYYNDSLHNHVRRMVAEQHPELADALQYKSATIGGAALSHHPLDRLLEPGRLGIDAAFDLVILQGGSAETLSATRRATFDQYLAAMSKAVRDTGAEVAYYMTHTYRPPHARYAPDQINTVASAYVEAGSRNRALVIPVGLAFEKAYARRPDLPLHVPFDGSHPNMQGTYLAACVVYATLYRAPASAIRYTYFGEVSDADAEFLRGIADETVREFFGPPPTPAGPAGNAAQPVADLSPPAR